MNIIYNTPRFIFINFYRLCVVRIRIINKKNIPENNSAIFSFNHTTGADPIIALGALRKKIYFIADSNRFKSKFTDFFFRKFTDSVPVFKKEFLKNVKSFKELFSIAKKKKIFFGIFPEGNLVKNGIFGEFRRGAAYLSYKTRLPIIPVYIHDIHKGPDPESKCGKMPVLEGIYSLFSNTFRKIHIFIGEPIDPVAENILADIKDMADKNSYKKIINRITSKLEKEFIELKIEAENLLGGAEKEDKKSNIHILKKHLKDLEETANSSSGIDIETGEDLAHDAGRLH